jgi:uncharacterized protein
MELTGEDLKRFSPATYFVQERKEYSFTLDEEANGLLINGSICRPIITGKPYYRICITHGLGLTCLQPTKEGKTHGEPVWVEAYSYKYETPEKHYRFYAAITADLFKKAGNLPFSFEAITQRGVIESAQPPTPLFTYYFLMRNLPVFQAAIETVLADPHRLLRDFPEQVLLHEVKEVDGDVILSILQSPETWTEVKTTGPTIAEALQVDGRRYAPTHVWQHLPEETFDTRENRFILHFLKQVLIQSEAMPRQTWWHLVEKLAESKAIIEMTSLLRETMAHPMFDEVGELHLIPFNSQVLMRREGYRDLFDLWHTFHTSAQPLFDKWQHAIDVRNMHHLYEIWVFFELINEIGGCQKITAHSSDEFGLENEHTSAVFENGGVLYYNKTFHPNWLTFRSYSMVFRPDYVWVRPDQSKVVLDAKFSMWIEEKELMSEAEIEVEDDTVQVTREARPVREDLNKMHTYRDALVGTLAAVVLYPGTVSMFMPLSGKRKQINLQELLFGALEGIGAIPIKPDACKEGR